jgi:hypothetical protein
MGSVLVRREDRHGRDKTIDLACIGWIVLDALVVTGALVRR